MKPRELVEGLLWAAIVLAAMVAILSGYLALWGIPGAVVALLTFRILELMVRDRGARGEERRQFRETDRRERRLRRARKLERHER